MANNSNTNTNLEYSKYDGLVGRDFLDAFFIDHGVTENEIAYYSQWDGYDNCHNIKNDFYGIEYATERVRSILAYRDMTIDDIRDNYDLSPWAWPTAKRFSEISSYCLPFTHKSLNKAGILMCIYSKQIYYFNINKDEPDGELLDTLISEGKWYAYTYAD